MNTDEERLSIVFSRIKEAVLVEDSKRTVKFANQAFVDTFAPGLAPEMLTGGDCDQAAVASAALFAEEGAWLVRTREIVQLGEDITDEEWQLKDGRWLSRDYAVRKLDGKVFEHMWIYRDSTAQHENFHSRTKIDPETNRPFTSVTQALISRINSLHAGEATKLGVTLIKLLAMDRVNSELGFKLGDDLINGVHADLDGAFGGQRVTRLRGATFAVCTDERTGHEVIEKINELLLPARRLNDQVVMLRYKIGLAERGVIAGSFDPASLLRAAQVALRTALLTGLNTIATKELIVKDRLIMDMDLRLPDALELNQLHMVFQPQLNLSTRIPLGFEAFVRWDHPERGTISAAEFIPYAEQIGLITRIDRWVISNVIPVVNRLLAHGGEHVAINLSAVTLEEDDHLLFLLESICLAENVNPTRVEIEVTETAVARAPKIMHDRLHKLRELGFRVAIDDFGVGQSGLALLKDVPFDTLKLDKYFVDSLDQPRTSQLIQAAANMAHALGAMILAEGVETKQQARLLIAAGVSAGQGWELGRPQSLSYFESAV
jgi:EAL domain-containing protein (putative c-di-GMP-specific phosphodiesterase class I)/GGDEF domain-containing protein